VKDKNLRKEIKGIEEKSGRSGINYRGSPGVRRGTANVNEMRVGRSRRTSGVKKKDSE